jgi:hypothetical protein
VCGRKVNGKKAAALPVLGSNQTLNSIHYLTIVFDGAVASLIQTTEGSLFGLLEDGRVNPGFGGHLPGLQPLDEQFIEMVDDHPRISIVVVPVVDNLSGECSDVRRRLGTHGGGKGRGENRKL